MSVLTQQRVAYGLSDALLNVGQLPIISLRAPTTGDKAELGTIWIFKPQNLAFILTSIVNNEAQWVNISQSPADFVRFTVQTPDANPVALATFAMAPHSSISLFTNVAAAQDDFSGAGGWTLKATFRREGAGPIEVSDTPIDEGEDFVGGDPTADFVIVGNSVVLEVTGIAATIINWKADVTSIIIS